MALFKKNLLIMSLAVFYTGAASAWPGITRGQMVDQDSSDPFNTTCSYRVLIKDSGVSNEVGMVSTGKLVFDTLIDDPNDLGKSDKMIASTFMISADKKMKATGSVIPGPYSSQFQKNLKAGEFEITEHSCVKLIQPDRGEKHHKHPKYHKKGA